MIDKDEMFDAGRVLNPLLTREEFEGMWVEFEELKREHQQKQALQ